MIDMVGAGAIGLLFAAKLIGSHQPVRIWTRTEEQACLLREEGLFADDRDGSTIHFKNVQAYPLAEAAERIKASAIKVEKLGLFVKQTHWNTDMLNMLKAMPAGDHLSVLCFQNGIGHLSVLQPVFPATPVLTAVTTEAAKRISPHHVVYTGSGHTWIGSSMLPEDKWYSHANGWYNLLKEAGFHTSVSNNIEGMVYQKLLINAVINPLTAILRIRNGELLAHDSRIRLMRSIYEEVKLIYDTIGIQVGEKDWQTIVQVCENTAGNTSSMLSDVQNGRRTEIDAITGALLRIADKHSLNTPVQRSLYLLVQALDPV